uniref:CCHC-type domain-containing protein n=1 Tax=Tanacetum cinerariifolium TaxID=118510 RepID=A0A6L2N9W6_TANCI|nr:hypothetical protein [Tanacetum cinerariifolium]
MCSQCEVILLNGICINCTYGDGKPVTCCVCEGPLRGGFCLFCDSKAENSFTYDPNAYYFNDTSRNFNHLPQPQYETYLCELCGNNSHYAYDCQSQLPFVYEQEPSYNQNCNDNYYPHDSPSILCCDNCGGSHNTFQCQPMDQDIDSSGLDQFQTPQYPVIHPPSQEISEEVFQAKRDLMKSIQTFLEKFNCIPFGEKPKILLQAWEKFFSTQHAQPEDSNKLFQKLLKDLQIINKELAEYINSPSWDRPTFFNNNEEHYIQYKEYLENPSNEIVASNLNQEKKEPPQDSDIRQLIREECCIEEVKNIVEQPTKRETRTAKSLKNFRVEKSSVSLNNTSQISSVRAITPILPTEEPEYSLRMGYKHLSTIPDTEPDEVIESSAKNLLPIPSEYEVTSNDESECDVPIKDESSLVFTTFLNPLFNDNNDFTSNDDESLSNEDILMEDFKVYSNSLFDDEEINSDKLDPHYFNVESDFVESLFNRDTLIDSSPKFDYLEEFSGAFMPTSIVDKKRIRREHKEYISLMEKFTDELLPSSIKSDVYDSEGDIHFLEELLVDNSISIPKSESFYFDRHDNPSFPCPPPEPPDVEFFFEPNPGEVIAAVMNNIDELNEDECFDPGGKDCAKTVKKQSKPGNIEHEIERLHQKPDQRTFFCKNLGTSIVTLDKPWDSIDGLIEILKATTTIKKVNDVVQLRALIDGKKVVVTEDVLRRDLYLDDADGVEYRKINFSKYIFDSMVRNVNSQSKILTYPYFLQVVIDNQVDNLTSHNTRYTFPALNQNVFANMQRVGKGFSGVETPLFASMLVQPQLQAEEEEEEDDEIPIDPSPPPHDPTPTPHATPLQDQPSTPQEQPATTSKSSMSLLTTLMETCASLSQKVAELEQDKHTQALEILQLKKRVKKLEKKKRLKSLGFKRLRKIEAIDADEDITLVDMEKDEEVVNMDAEPQGRINQEEVNATSKGVSAVETTVFNDEEVKYLIIEWEIHTEEKFSSSVPNVDKDKALWVELKRLFEPDADDVLWKLQRYMHYPITWKMYTNCGVHQVSLTTRRHDMFLLTEKDYPLLNDVMILMLSRKLQVEEDNEMARDLVMKIFMEANKPKSRSLDTSSK